LHRLLAQHPLQPKGDTVTPRGTWGNFGRLEVGVGKNGVLQNKSGNISETRKDGGKVTMEVKVKGATYPYRGVVLPSLGREPVGG